MSTDGASTKISSAPAPRQRDPEAEVAAHFEVAVFSVSAALTGALITALVVAGAGVLQSSTALPWLAFMIGMGVIHIGLSLRYRRVAPERRRWRLWAAASSVITFAESLGWGLAPLALPRLDSAKAVLLVMLTTIGVSAGSVIGYGRYLPTRVIAFLTPTLPFLFYSLRAQDPVVHGTFFLLILYMIAIGHLGLEADRGFQREVSMRKRNAALAQELAREKQIAERATVAKSAFLAAASHDLRQPIHALGLYLGALRISELPQDAATLVDKMDVSIVAMDRLFSGILDISRLDAGVVETHRNAFDLNALLEGLAGDFEEEARQKGIRFSIEPTQAVVKSDRFLLERIVRNIVSNAIRYTQRGGVQIRCRRRGSKLALQVWDSGCGIAKRHLSSIFDEYFQIANPERDREKGLGLGLAIVRRLSALIDADVTVRSREGRGSCFSVHISLAPPGARCEPWDLIEAIVPDGKGLIVVVDDEAQILDGMREVLGRWGYTVVCAEAWAQALSLLEGFNQPPSLLICDYRLREHETGAAVAHAFRERFGDQLPAILITGDTAPARLAEAQASECLLLHKPLPYGKLRATIGSLIRNTPKAGLAEELSAPAPEKTRI
jgi:signal transduction histidine kinase/CheY-like chemotaxis protein